MKRTPLKRTSSLKRSRMRSVITIDEEWREVRLQVLERDNSFCQAYGQFGVVCLGKLHVHHILPRSRGGKHNMENLVTLCSAHHQWAHGNPLAAKGHGLIK